MDTAINIAFSFAQEKLSFISLEAKNGVFKFPHSIAHDSQQQENVCQIFSLIDHIAEFDHPRTKKQRAEVVGTYTSKMMIDLNPQSLTSIKQELEEFRDCIDLLKQISAHKVNKNDVTLDDYIQEKSTNLFTKVDLKKSRIELKEELKKALQAVSSNEVTAVKNQVNRLYQRAFLPSLTGISINESRKRKAKAIEDALISVPVLSRQDAFSSQPHIRQ